MAANVRGGDLQLFLDLANLPRRRRRPDQAPWRALVPAFMVGELRRAFEMGFLLYLPFLVIDMVVASVLMSLGMMMLPPSAVSLPFKLIFFVLVDGWRLVAGSLVQSFATGMSGNHGVPCRVGQPGSTEARHDSSRTRSTDHRAYRTASRIRATTRSRARRALGGADRFGGTRAQVQRQRRADIVGQGRAGRRSGRTSSGLEPRSGQREREGPRHTPGQRERCSGTTTNADRL